MKRRMLCFLLILALMLPVLTVAVSAAGFRDIPSGVYYEDAVEWAVENGITNGTSATTFSPSAPCTRAQVVTFLWRYYGQEAPTTTQSPFRDVQAGDQTIIHYYDAILWAYENGITTGKTADTFDPHGTVTRGEFVTFLWRCAGKPEPIGANPFPDVSQSEFYYTPVIWAVENGITNGTSSGGFEPKSTCIRAQVVTFLYRFEHPLTTEEEDPTDPPANVEVYTHELWQEAKKADLTTLPRYNDAPTAENAKAILSVCSPDGYLIFRTNEGEAMRFMEETVTAGLDTAIHETFHNFCSYNFYTQAHYLGEGRYVLVPETDTYRSQEMAETIPEELRTFRYDPYVGADSDGLASNENGIYGLLNEFNAYWTGMRHNVSMFDYYCAQDHSFTAWSEYFNGCENNRQAYSEFRYYILTYLLYARENYPNIYHRIMNNDALRYAFRVVDYTFRKDIEQYESTLQMISNGKIPEASNISITDSYIWFDNGDGSRNGMGRQTDYYKLMEAMEDSKYQKMYALFQADTYNESEDDFSAEPVYPTEPEEPDTLPESGDVEVYTHELWQTREMEDLCSLPLRTDPTTLEAATAILRVCNPDGYLMFRTNEDVAMDTMADTVTVGMDSAVSEASRSFCATNPSAAQSHYLGSGWYVLVPPTETYRSREMGETIPEELRTFRYYCAVGEDSDGMASNENGIYGLLSEFNAHWLGMRHAVSMFDYYSVQDPYFETWSEYLSDCDNNRQAYAEFRYYILTYLLYARENYPEIYQGITENDELRYAFRVIDDRFTKDIARFDKQLQKMANGEVSGLKGVEVSDNIVMMEAADGSYHGYVLHTDYFTLMEAMEDAGYQEMYALLRG